MTHTDDGDLIRGLGYVVLYAAYLEEALDECLTVIASQDPDYDNRLHRRPTSQKIEYIQQQLRKWEPLSQDLICFPMILQTIGGLLEERNHVIHGRIYAVPGLGDVRISGRPGVPEALATSAELYDLANTLASACNPLLHAAVFSLHRQFRGVAPPIGGAT